MPEKPSIGFIGLGLMGQAFTKRLNACGYIVTGFDIAAEKIEQATKHGVIAAVTPDQVKAFRGEVGKPALTVADLIAPDAAEAATPNEQ